MPAYVRYRLVLEVARDAAFTQYIQSEDRTFTLSLAAGDLISGVQDLAGGAPGAEAIITIADHNLANINWLFVLPLTGQVQFRKDATDTWAELAAGRPLLVEFITAGPTTLRFRSNTAGGSTVYFLIVGE